MKRSAGGLWAVLAAVMLLWGSAPAADDTAAGVQRFTLDQDGQKLTRLETISGNASPVSALDSPAPLLPSLGLDATDDFVGQLLWQTGDPSGMCNDCAVSPDGGYFGLGISLNNERAELYQSASSMPLWNFPVQDGGTYPALSQNCGVYAFSYQHYLSLFNAASATPLWTYDYGATAYAGPVAVSRDGSRIVAGCTQGSTGRIISFAPGSSVPQWETVLTQPSSFGFYGVRISADGSKISANSKFTAWILDAATGNVLWEGETNNTEYAIPMSADGGVIAIGSLSNGSVRVLGWNNLLQDYVELWHYTMPGGTSRWCSAVEVSADGSTVAAGSLVFLTGGYDGNLAVFETWGTGQPLWLSSTFGDMVGAITLSDDGLTVAAGSWGDMGNSLTDLRVYEKYTSTPFYTYNHPGSINSVAMSADGTRIFAGGKHVHNRYFGNGGDAYAVSASLGGGTVSGTVAVAAGTPMDIRVEVLNANRYAYTNALGQYSIPNVPAGTHSVRAGAPGFTTATQPGIVVPEGGQVTVNFNLAAVTGAPANLAATSGQLTSIPLAWSLTDLAGRQREARVAVGDEAALPLCAAPVREAANPFLPGLAPDNTDDADSIRIYRSMLPGGPYAQIASIGGTATQYTDTYQLFPTLTYYYVVSALYPQGESSYSNEASASLDDSYLVYDPVIPAQTAAVTFDGVLTPGEWADAVRLDISDVFGYDQPDPPGSVFMYLKYNDLTDKLLIACEDHLNASLDDNEGMGFYVDDNDDNAWTYAMTGTEGNYWAYWHPYGADLRYRSLSGGPYASAYYYFPSPELAFSQAAGYVTYEFSVPMGFRNVYDLALYGPDKSPGIGAFSISRVGGNAIFNGWWPQNMASIVSNPEQFGDCPINATLVVPPAAVNDLVVEREGNSALRLTWTDPDSGIDNLPLASFAGLEIWRNGVLLTTVNPGVQTYLDATVQPYGWYEYSLRGWVVDAVGNLYGPASPGQGAYVTQDPTLTTLAYDDGGWEGIWIVSSSPNDNQFAVRCTPLSYPTAVWTIQVATSTADSVMMAVAADENGNPGTVLAGPYFFVPGGNYQFSTFHIPELDQPVITAGDFWIKLLWLNTSPSEPAVCVDETTPQGRSKWYDNTSGWTNLTAGNIMMRAGVGAAPAANPDVSITLAPVGGPIQIPATGGSFSFNATLLNGETTPQTFDAWIMVRLPNQTWYGPVLGPLALTLPGGANLTRLRQQTVPGTAPAGSYWYEGRVGDYPDAIWDTSGFAFTKLAAGSGPWVGGWNNTGESFEPYLAQPQTALPTEYALDPAHPNPFNPSAALGYRLPASGRVTLRVYDTAGREVRTLVNGWQDAGVHEVTFDASGLPSGIYFARLTAGGFTQVQKLILLK
ncbi:MAG: T9SS C-terminal target domain-containing protein [Candidatus Zixiibacteriota bacterium]|nr:MAG: T9SS C-terminal target domain-containing protein [candidate division Zixibacteria bacterium]